MRIVCKLERPSELSWRARHGRKKKLRSWLFSVEIRFSVHVVHEPFLLKRHWLESEILPYVLRYLAPFLDPALVATVAATGLYFREGNTLEDLVDMDLLPGDFNKRRTDLQDLSLHADVGITQLDTGQDGASYRLLWRSQ